MLTDIKGADNFGCPVLYISGGIHWAEYGPLDAPDWEKLVRFVDEQGYNPIATHAEASLMAEIQRIMQNEDLPLELRGAVVAIGNFDGVHQGHQAVLDRALEIAKEAKRPAIVLTFEPHPRTVFAPHKPVFRLTPAPQKAEILAELGFDGVVEHAFSMGFASQSPETFVADFLCGQLGVAHVVTGFDFHFGKDREGGPAYLIEAGGRLGFWRNAH